MTPALHAAADQAPGLRFHRTSCLLPPSGRWRRRTWTSCLLVWSCVNARRSGSHCRLSYHWFPDARGRQRPRTWLPLVGVYKVQLVGHLAHRWQHLLAEQPQAGHPILMATWAMGIPEGKDAGAYHLDKLPEL